MQPDGALTTSTKLSFIPPGRVTTIRLLLQTDLQHALAPIFENFKILPHGWNHFAVLRDHNLRTTNLTGRGLQDGKESILRLSGEVTNKDLSDPDLPLVPVSLHIYTTFLRTVRIGENEYSWHASLPDRLTFDDSFPNVKSLLMSPDFKFGSCHFGLTRYRRLNFGPIANPFPVATGELSINCTPTEFSISASYLRKGDLPELSSIALNLANLKINNELLDHLGESH